MRICSLLPSATEIVSFLGLEDQLVAVSHECDYPDAVKAMPKATASVLETAKMQSGRIDELVQHHMEGGKSLYRLDVELLEQLKPDLILTQELCRVCAVSYDQVEKAARILEGNPKIVSLEPQTLSGILDNILLVGDLTGKKPAAARLVEALRTRIQKVASTARKAKRTPRVLCLEWLDPPWVGGHWIPEIVRLAGGHGSLGNEGKPSTPIEWWRIVQYAPEVIVLMPCGFDVKRTIEESSVLKRHSGWFNLPAAKSGRVYAVDASSYYSRPGPRVIDGLEILAKIIQPSLFRRRYPDTVLQACPELTA